jgi:[histone H3]-lysine27 N-trimethyltransferase EZH2
MPPRGEKRGETGEKRGETGDPQLPASTADETATTGKDGSTGFDLALESNEALAAMDDTAFTRAVTRCLASHRKIFSGQQHNWASVRLAANLPPTLRGVAAEDARRKARSSAGVADGIADRGDSEGCIIPSDASLAAATVRRWENGAASGSAEARSQCLAKTLPAVRNVPPYTSYIYSAHENSYVQDEVRRRLMLRDNEGELYQELSEDEDHSDDSDSGDGSPAPSDSEGGAGKDDRGRRVRRQTARAEKKEKKKDAAKRDKEEETDKIEEAAANRHWDRRTDYLIYAAVVCLGATTRCIEAVAENLRMDPKILRARMRLLQRQPARGVNERDKAERARRAVSIAATHEDAKAAHEAGVRVAQEFRAALAKAKGDVKVGEEGTGVKVEVDADGSDDGSEDVDEEDEVVTRGSRATRGKEKKGNTHAGNTHAGNTHAGNTHEGNTHEGNTHEGNTHDDDVGDVTRRTITRRETRGMADATNLPSAREVMRTYSRETKLWNLVAWRFLMEPDPAEDIHGELPPQPDVDPALDSFRTLYCPRCHHYDCNLHGCGHVLPGVKLGEEAVNKNPHPRSKTHMEALKRAAKEAEEAAAAVAAPPAEGTRPRSPSPRAVRGVGSSRRRRDTVTPTPAPRFASTRRGSSARPARPRRRERRRRGRRRRRSASRGARRLNPGGARAEKGGPPSPRWRLTF